MDKLTNIQRFMQQLFDEDSRAKSASEIGQAILAARSIRLTDIAAQMSGESAASYKRIQRFLKVADPREALWRLFQESAEFVIGDPTEIERPQAWKTPYVGTLKDGKTKGFWALVLATPYRGRAIPCGLGMLASALVAIEPPAEWNARAVRDEKVKVLRAVRKTRPAEVERDTVRGQYAAGAIARKRVFAYREEEEVAADSQVETYAALKLYIDNSRWAGVPFYLRSGKRLARRATEIVIEFKPAPHTPWSPSGTADGSVRSNLLIVNVSPDEGIIIRVETKRPGQAMQLQSVNLDYYHSDVRGATELPSAYEHLLLDSMHGDPTFFARADEVEAAWAIVEPIIKRWELEKALAFPNYVAGSPGPVAADELLARDGRQWYGSTDQARRKPGR